jgi:hypothetical protein
MNTFHAYYPLRLVVWLFGLPAVITLLCRYVITDGWNVRMPWKDAVMVGAWVVCFMLALAFVLIVAQLLTNAFGVLTGILFVAGAVAIPIWIEHVIFQRHRRDAMLGKRRGAG